LLKLDFITWNFKNFAIIKKAIFVTNSAQIIELEADVHEKVFNNLEEGETYDVAVFGFAIINDEELESPTGDASATTSN